jgi:hypothetical protein
MIRITIENEVQTVIIQNDTLGADANIHEVAELIIRPALLGLTYAGESVDEVLPTD